MKKKGILIVVIIILVILALASGGFAYIYLGTDWLLSERQGFEKYAVQLVTDDTKFIPSFLENYFNKKNSTPYTTEGAIDADIQLIGASEQADVSDVTELTKILEYSNDVQINFQGQVDNSNNKFEQNVTINYSDNINLPFTYRADGDVFGIQSDTIGQTFIAFQNNNLPEFANKFGITGTGVIPNKVEIPKIADIALTDTEKLHIVNNYIMPIYTSITDAHFSKQENPDGTVTYILTLKNEELKNLFIQALEILSEDQLMLDKLNNVIIKIMGNNYNENSMKINTKTVKDFIIEQNNTTIEEGVIQFKLTQEKRKVKGIEVVSNENSVNIVKSLEKSQSVAYSITVQKNGFTTHKLNLSIGAVNENSTNEQYVLEYNVANVTHSVYQYSNTVTYTPNVSIGSLNSTNAAILNNYSEEQLLPFLEQLGTRIVQINTDQMMQLGYESNLINPLYMWINAPSYVASITRPTSEQIQDAGSLFPNIFEETDSTVGANEVDSNTINVNEVNTNEIYSNTISSNVINTNEINSNNVQNELTSDEMNMGMANTSVTQNMVNETIDVMENNLN